MAKNPQKSDGPLTLEERLLQNAVDTVANNLDHYDAVHLVHLVHAILDRRDTHVGILRAVTEKMPEDVLACAKMERKPGGIGGDELESYLTLPTMHRRQLAMIQALQEQLMPAGMLRQDSKMGPGEAARLATQCTTQMEKLLRMTKAVKATAEVNRLREAIGAGLAQVAKGVDQATAGKVLELLQEGMRRSLTASKNSLERAMEKAEEMGG